MISPAVEQFAGKTDWIAWKVDFSTVRDLPGEGSYVVNPLGDDGSASVLFVGEVVAVIEPGT